MWAGGTGGLERGGRENVGRDSRMKCEISRSGDGLQGSVPQLQGGRGGQEHPYPCELAPVTPTIPCCSPAPVPATLPLSRPVTANIDQGTLLLGS